MNFEAGQSGNPTGRPKGSCGGRIMALASLDTLLGKKKNQKALMAALEKDLLRDPVRFFKTVIMPLLPREAKLSFDHDGVIQWKSLLGGMTEDSGQLAEGSEEKIAAAERASHIGDRTTIDIRETGSSEGV